MGVELDYNVNKFHPPAPEGWQYWYTYHWFVNKAHILRGENFFKLYLDHNGNLVAELEPGEETQVTAAELPCKLYVYKPIIARVKVEVLSDTNRLARLTRVDPEDR